MGAERGESEAPPSLYSTHLPAYPEPGDVQLGYLCHPITYRPSYCYRNSHMTRVHTQETPCNLRAASAHVCSQLLDGHKPMNTRSPAQAHGYYGYSCQHFPSRYANSCVCAKLSPTLCDPMDHSPPGSSVPGILQARRLEWVAMPFSRGSS